MKRLTPKESWPPSWKESYQYDQLELYDNTSYLGYAYSYSTRKHHIIELVSSVAKPGATVLDVAAAQGNFSIALSEMGYDVTWNDLRSELAPYVEMKHERGKLSYITGDVFTLQATPLFDVVLAAEVVEHVAHPDAFLRKIASLVKPGGYVVLSTPNGQYFRNKLPRFSECPDPSQYESLQFRPNADGHIFLLYDSELIQLATEAALTTVELRLFSNPLTSGHLQSEPLLRRLPRSWVKTLEDASGYLPRSLKRRLLTSMAGLFLRSV
jgi:2-polyprenyl-3-methyl-5-hydroxy-6-metoxy-1,4-benzoquinol methylase